MVFHRRYLIRRVTVQLKISVTGVLFCAIFGIITGCAEKNPSHKEPSQNAARQNADKSSSEEKPPVSEDKSAQDAVFRDDPAAHALYNQMIEALHKADSLSFTSQYEIVGKGEYRNKCEYKAWLKKPNYFRVEGQCPVPDRNGILIGDGNTLWIYWPKGRPKMFGDEDNETEADKQKRLNSYMKKPAPLAAHSIGHEVGNIGVLGMTILDLSTFHGYTDSLQQYLDGVRSLPDEKVGDEECKGIEVSIMKHQRSWYIWISKQDHIPRKLKQVVRVSYDIVMSELWSSVALNADMPDALFSWKPPEGWTQWTEPPIEIGLLKPGAKAPDFDLATADGNKIKLSDYRGKTVWFYVWRAG
jgi:outer membrane lipoprotein-sorting protein